jgi:cytochrome c oxidase subunit 2
MRGRTARTGLVTLGLLMAVGCGGSDAGLSGADLALEVGCTSCHGEADTDLAPTLRGVWGTEVLLEDGRTVVADEAYVRTSITDPGADIVVGYDGRMPTFSLTDSELDRLVEYVRTLG